MPELLIRNASIIDGTGQPAFEGDVVVADGRIDRIGDVGEINAEREFDAGGRIACPGFIDIHSHSDFTLIANRNVESGIRQGITSVVTGNCGHGPAPAPCKDLAKGNTLGFNEAWGLDFTWDSFEEYVETLLTPGIAMNAARLLGAGDAKFMAAAAPLIALADLGVVTIIFLCCLLAGFFLHRIAKASPLRRLAPDWKSWDAGRRFPMGMPLALTLVSYLVWTLVQTPAAAA